MIAKGVIRSRISKKDKQYNGLLKRDKEINNGPQNNIQKTDIWSDTICKEYKSAVCAKKSDLRGSWTYIVLKIQTGCEVVLMLC
jgi:hypothetical protein